ncbi:MAG TPA: hypothetical protein DD791_01575 [Syntrophomonas sp.]|nr:hypothetical protein [Syntrophomonas sp.]
MNLRELSEALVKGFDMDIFKQFLSSANESFKPSYTDYSIYVDNHEFISDLYKIGEIEFDTIERLIVVVGNLNSELSSKSGKKGQYEIGRKILKQELYDAGLFLFYDNSGQFRFSLITAIYLGNKRIYSNYRRYTYYVSPLLANKTFITQMSKSNFKSLDSIQEAFSLEAVSENFYNDFNPQFRLLTEAVTGHKRVDLALAEDFALLFVIRIIFLGFVQKKGWLGERTDFMQFFWQEYQASKHKEKFYKCWLEPLFFEALNSPPGHKLTSTGNEFSQSIQEVLQMAPFLNGELFKRIAGIDDQGLLLPDNVIAEFFDFLFQYNFTIEENTRYDEELELNPEFLGIIFERLVNKADGAVYTPRIEVDFMCRLALVKWLEENSSCQYEDLYYLFFREKGRGDEYDEDQKQGNFSTKQMRELIDLLENVAICDPAAGSGAFEVGMLQVLSEVIEQLYHHPLFPQDVTRKDPFTLKRDLIASCLYGVEVKPWAVWINQLRLWLTLFIDMPYEYCYSYEPLLPSLNFKVRCGDSLVQQLGSKSFPVHGYAVVSKTVMHRIRQLKKNKIDFFHNRLKSPLMIEKMEKDIYKLILEEEINELRKELRGFVSAEGKQQINLFGADYSPVEQPELEINENEKRQLQARITQLELQKNALQDTLPFVWSIEFAEVFFEKGGFDIIIGNPPYVRQEEIADPNGITDAKKYKQALQEVVRLDYDYYFGKQTKIDGKSDLYTYFYLRSLRLLNSKGIHCFICSNSWLDVGYGGWMQEFLLRNVPMHFIVDNHARRSFASADINTIITLFAAPQKCLKPDAHAVKFVAFSRPFEEVIFTENLLKMEQVGKLTKTGDFRIFPVKYSTLLNEGSEYDTEEQRILDAGKYIGDKWGGKYLRAPDIFFTIMEKGRDKIIRLNEVATALPGCYSGINDFFYISEETVSKFGIEEEYLTPLIRNAKTLSTLIIQNISEHFVLNVPPVPKKHLKSGIRKYINWGEQQVTRGGQKTKSGIPWNQTVSVRTRKYWYSIPKKNLQGSNLFMQYVANDRFYCPFSPQEMVSDRCFHRIFPKNLEKFYFLAVSLNSTLQMLFVMLLGRSNLGQGALKFETKDANNIYMFNPDMIENINLKEILNRLGERKPISIFIECGIDPESNIPIEQQEPNPLPDRAALDKIIFDALGLSDEERKDVYRAVCRLVWNRVSKAKSV